MSTYPTHTSGPRRCKKLPATLLVPQMQENISANAIAAETQLPVAGEDLDEEEKEELDEEDNEEEDNQQSLHAKMVQAFSDFLQ